MIAGRQAGLSHKASTNIGVNNRVKGEFSIIMANIGMAGGLMSVLKPFSALYVLILSILGPLFTKESRKIYKFLNKIFKWDKKCLNLGK
ncbi:K(+)/H(+) antiporter subunit KhtU (plasmid) [Bacillus thuringiensis]|nr:K(+)/H(+) antiporter subunit KhtU [Bacillus thuringiensis]